MVLCLNNPSMVLVGFRDRHSLLDSPLPAILMLCGHGLSYRRLSSQSYTSHLYSLRDFWRHFGLSRSTAYSDCCFFALCTNILTYLLL